MPAIQSKAPIIRQFSGKVSYPWSTWADGKARRLKRGTHFHTTVRHFVISAHNWARRNGKRLNTRKVSDSEVEILFHSK